MKISSLLTASMIGLASPTAQGQEICSPEIREYISEPELVCESDDVRKEVAFVVGSIVGLGAAGYIGLRRRRKPFDWYEGDPRDKSKKEASAGRLPLDATELVRESIELLGNGEVRASEEALKKALDLSGHHDKSIYISYLSLLHELCALDPSESHRKQYFIFFHRTCMHFRHHVHPELGHADEMSLTQGEFEKIRDWGKEIDPKSGLYSAASLEDMFSQRRLTSAPDLPVLHDELPAGSTLTPHKSDTPVEIGVEDTLPGVTGKDQITLEGGLVPSERGRVDHLLATLEDIEGSEVSSVLRTIDEIILYYSRSHSGLQEKIKLTILGLRKNRKFDYVTYGMKKLGFSNKESVKEQAISMMEARKIEIALDGVYQLAMIEKDIALTLGLLMAAAEDSDFSYARGFIACIKRYCIDHDVFLEFKKKLIEKGEMGARLFDIHLALRPFKD